MTPSIFLSVNSANPQSQQPFGVLAYETVKIDYGEQHRSGGGENVEIGDEEEQGLTQSFIRSIRSRLQTAQPSAAPSHFSNSSTTKVAATRQTEAKHLRI
jgi:hypothetical protein